MNRKQISLFKHCLERCSIDPAFRTEMERCPESAVAQALAGMELYSEAAAVQAPLIREAIDWLLFRRGDRETAKRNPYVSVYEEQNKIVMAHVRESHSLSSIGSERMFYYLDTQRNRCRMESRDIRHQTQIYYYPFAFELSDGCRVQCPFCAFKATAYKESFLYTKEHAALFREALLCAREYAGELLGDCPCYFATEPLDNPDYEKFLADFREIAGTVPQTTTAAAERCPERVHALMDWLGEDTLQQRASLRFSVHSLRQYKALCAAYTPEQLRWTELLAVNPESAARYSQSGRAAENQNIPGEKKLRYSISCIAGIKINFCRRTMEFIEPELPDERHPLGYSVLERRTFTDAASLRQGIRAMMDQYAVGLLPDDRRLRINKNVRMVYLPDGVVFEGDLVGYEISRTHYTSEMLAMLEGGASFLEMKDRLGLLEQEAAELRRGLGALFQRGYVRCRNRSNPPDWGSVQKER